jgi:hypothetical protein
MRLRFPFRLGFVAVLSALGAASCLSPTLPLPPPDIEAVSQALDGKHWTVSGDCTPGAVVTVFNEETGRGVVVEDRNETGHWTVSLEATKCDLAWAEQEHGTDHSQRNTFVVDVVTPDQPSGSGTCK